MTPAAIVQWATSAGVQLVPEGAGLRCIGALSPELRDQLRAHKPAVLAHLQAQAPAVHGSPSSQSVNAAAATVNRTPAPVNASPSSQSSLPTSRTFKGPAATEPDPTVRAEVARIEGHALALGWTPAELWRCDGRTDERGLVAVLRPGDEVVRITRAAVYLQRAGGAVQSFGGDVKARGTAGDGELRVRLEAQGGVDVAAKSLNLNARIGTV